MKTLFGSSFSLVAVNICVISVCFFLIRFAFKQRLTASKAKRNIHSVALLLCYVCYALERELCLKVIYCHHTLSAEKQIKKEMICG